LKRIRNLHRLRETNARTASKRRFTKVHAGMGGKKVKRRGRAYYEGTALQEKLTSPVRIVERVANS